MTEDPFRRTMLDYANLHENHDPVYARIIKRRIESYATLSESLAVYLSERLGCDDMPAAVLFKICNEALHDDDIIDAFREDLLAYEYRDPACKHHSEAFLLYKGFHATQAARVAHYVYKRHKTGTARFLQSRISEVFNVDIHPHALLGKGLMIDHACGVVIGETARIGNGCSILHNVTLGGNGTELGDRHPKLCDNVLVGTGATILGNVTIGAGARVAASSVVLTSADPETTVAGIPARVVGQYNLVAAKSMDHFFSEI